VFILNNSLEPDWIKKKSGVKLTDAVIDPVDIRFEAPTPENEPVNEPVKEVAINDPEINVEPETINPFFTLNSPAIFFTLSLSRG